MALSKINNFLTLLTDNFSKNLNTNILCTGAGLVGIFFYSKYFSAKMIPTCDEMKKSGTTELKAFVTTLEKNRSRQTIFFLVDIFIAYPMFSVLNYYEIISPKCNDYGIKLLSILLGVHSSIIISNTFSIINCSDIISIKEYYQHDDIRTLTHMNEEILQRIKTEKCSWIFYMFDYNNRKAYLIQNAFHLNLIFL